MDQEQAKQMLVMLCHELLQQTPGTTAYTFDEIAGMMAKRFCADHLAGFVSAWGEAPCVCGQAVCPSGLKRAVLRCFYSAPRARGNQNAPTSRCVH